MRNTTEVLHIILDRLYSELENTDWRDLTEIEESDLRDSISAMRDLAEQPHTFTGDPQDDILHHLFFWAGLDSQPRDRLINWVEELAQ